MSDEPGARGATAEFWSSFRSGRLVLAAAAVVFGVLAAIGALAPFPAIVGFSLIAAAALLAAGNQDPRPSLRVAPVGDAPGAGAAPPGEALIAGLPDPVVVLDRNGIVVAFNRPAGAVAPALRRAEPVSLALRMPNIVEAIRRAMATGDPQRVEFSERVPVGRSYEAYVMPLAPAVATGDFAGHLLVTLHDLTPLRRIEEMRADFVANASHELRTPLASLSGFIDTLQGPAREDAAARERFLDIMKGQARRMARLIDDLLSLSRVELNEHIHPAEPVDLVPIVRQVVDSLQKLAGDRAVEVALSVPPEPLNVLGDRDELVRVVENLVENALKYGAAGKRVDIDVRGRLDGMRAEATVSVRDHGPGIAPEHLPRLTERFYRIDVGQSRAEGGTGLGLALVKHVLNRHRGRLTVESTIGAGSTFTVHLPAVAAAALSRNNEQDQPLG